MLGVTPFQYNPVTKELKVYRELDIEIVFEGGTDQFGDNKYRSRWFDPILQDALLNWTSLPAIDYAAKQNSGSREAGCEYLIVTPNGADFQQWADSLKEFRTDKGF